MAGRRDSPTLATSAHAGGLHPRGPAMTQTWQRRAAGITGLVALLGVALLLVAGSRAGLDRSTPQRAFSDAAATDHSAFVALPESRPTFAFVETIALLGLGGVFAVALLDLSTSGVLLAGADGIIRHRRWRARLIGAPPVVS